MISVIIGISVIIASAQKNVRQEILSTQSLAIFAIENGIEKNPEIYLFQEEGQTLGLANLNELRHLKIQFFDAKNQLRDQTSSDLSMLNFPPKWFISIIEDFSTILPEKRISIKIRSKEYKTKIQEFTTEVKKTKIVTLDSYCNKNNIKNIG